MKKEYHYLLLYLSIAFGASWLIGLSFLFFSDFMIRLTGGPLTQNNPIVVLVLYLPSIAGVITCIAMGGFSVLKPLMAKFIPRKEDLFWFPLLFALFVVFALFMHYCSIFCGIAVPKITLTIPGMITKALANIVEEVGLIGGIFGWMAFLLPYLQKKLKSNVTASLLTGIIFGLWVLPGYLVTSFEQTTSFILYVEEIILFFMFISYIFNATKGNLLFYLYTFWLTATGSHIQLYYWNMNVQMMQISFFAVAVLAIYYIFKMKKVDDTLVFFPNYLQDSKHLKETYGAVYSK